MRAVLVVLLGAVCDAYVIHNAPAVRPVASRALAPIMAAKKAQQQAMDMLQANYASVVGLLEKSEAERKQALADVESLKQQLEAAEADASAFSRRLWTSISISMSRGLRALFHCMCIVLPILDRVKRGDMSSASGSAVSCLCSIFSDGL